MIRQRRSRTTCTRSRTRGLALSYQYERVSNDPRLQHALTLDVDDFGIVTSAATIAYPRRTPDTEVEAQGVMLISVAETEVIHEPDQVHWYRIGVPLSATGYQLTGLSAPTAPTLLGFDAVKSAVDGATVIAYDATPTTGNQKRVLSRQRIYYDADDLTGALSLGSIESLALPHHEERLAFTAGLLTSVYGTNVTSTMLAVEGGYLADSGDYWAPGPRPIYDADHFYLPIGVVEPFGNESSVAYDVYSLLVVEAHSSTTTTALDNVITLENDYRVLQPKSAGSRQNQPRSVALPATKRRSHNTYSVNSACVS